MYNNTVMHDKMTTDNNAVFGDLLTGTTRCVPGVEAHSAPSGGRVRFNTGPRPGPHNTGPRPGPRHGPVYSQTQPVTDWDQKKALALAPTSQIKKNHTRKKKTHF